MAEGEQPKPATMVMDLRDVNGHVQSRGEGDEREYVIVLNDGHSHLELISGQGGGRHTAALFGAQRLATIAIDYAVGLLGLDLPPKPL
jgi:hypothetical protein